MDKVPLPPKKLNHKVCIICCCECDVHDTDKMELFTKTVMKQFLTPSQVTSLSGSKVFNFCISCCTEILEDLGYLQTSLNFIQENVEKKNLDDDQQLQISMKFILNSIKQKKLEIKIKILNSPNGIHDNDSEALRKFLTRDFCPRIQMKRDDRIEILSLPNSFENELNCVDINDCDDKELQNGISLDDIGGSSTITEETMICESNQDPSTELQSMKINSMYRDDKIRSEEISIQPKTLLQFVEQETVVKFEPWHDFHFEDESIDEFIEYPEESVQDLEDSESIEHSYSETNLAKKILNGNYGVSFEKFQLSKCQLCLLAMLTSDKVQVPLGDVFDFVQDNFPTWSSRFTGAKTWKQGIRTALNRCSYITKVLVNNYTQSVRLNQQIYQIRKNDEKLIADLKILEEKLNDLKPIMAFPDRLVIFKEAVLRKISEVFRDNLGSEQPSETNFGEMFSFVETAENVVKIEHCVYAMESEDSLTEDTQQIEYSFRNCETVPRVPMHTSQISPTTDKRVSKLIVDQGLAYDTNSLRALRNPHEWPKPSLSYNQMCILAILNSSRLFVTVTEAQNFIAENFPFYATDLSKLHDEIQSVLSLPTFTKLKYQENFYDGQILDQNIDNYFLKTVYTVQKGTAARFWGEKISKTLSLDENVVSMAYPERIPTFIENLMTNECTVIDNKMSKRKPNISKNAYDVQSGDSFSGSTPEIENPSPNYETVTTNPAEISATTDRIVSKSRDLIGDRSSAMIRKSRKDWPQPSLSYNQMCILAILNSSRLFVTVTDAQNFITENFPFYANVPNLHDELQSILSLPTFTKLKYQEDFGHGQLSDQNIDNYFLKTVYTVQKGTAARFWTEKIAKKLRLDEIAVSMAYPERIATFIENMMKNECTVTNNLIPKEKRNSSKTAKFGNESKRRLEQRISFQSLWKLIPDICKDSRYSSKIRILEQAKKYIQQLENWEKQLIKQKSSAKQKNRFLLEKYRKLDTLELVLS